MNLPLNRPFTLLVDDFFHFADGSTVFVGTLQGGDSVIVPAEVDIFIGGALLGRIQLTEERMPGPAIRGKRIVVTHDPVNHSALRAGPCVLVHV
jgi:hypothetical protein